MQGWKKGVKMRLQNMFKKTGERENPVRKGRLRRRPEAPEGLLKKCNKGGAAILSEEVINGAYICPKCHGYFRVPAYKRIEMIADEGSFEEWDMDLDGMDGPPDPLQFKGYSEKIKKLREQTGLKEAVVTGRVKINGKQAVIGVCDGRFMMASMGYAVGEKITRAVERATNENLPVILFTCSGGARMQEGIISLMQMEKTSAALKRHSDAGLLYVTVLTDPTTGGVTASFAMLGDIIIAEPQALIGFAGPRVIEQTIGEKLPEGFQRAEFLLEHGFVDQIVKRENMKPVLGRILKMHDHVHPDCRKGKEIRKSDRTEPVQKAGMTEKKAGKKAAEQEPWSEKSLTAWERVCRSRSKERPVGKDYIDILFSSKSIADLLNNAEYVDKISEYDRSMFANYKKTWDEVNTRKAAVESMIETLKSKKLEQKEDKYDLELLRKNKKKQMKQFEQSQKKNQKKANELAKEAAKAENEVNRLLAQKQAEIDGSDSGIVFSGGALSWPLKVSGRISSKFGHRSSPTAGASTYHKGLDIAVPSGTPILAAAAGKVVTAHYSSSAGNYIMIAHGNRLYTVYMHCSRLAVKEGDSVVQGQTIGYAGSTGISTGSHLHFGVSKNGSYVNPLNYVSR